MNSGCIFSKPRAFGESSSESEGSDVSWMRGMGFELFDADTLINSYRIPGCIRLYQYIVLDIGLPMSHRTCCFWKVGIDFGAFKS